MMFQFYAQGWFILELTGSAALLGLLGVARGSGMLAFSLFGGALADGMDRRTLLMATQTAALAVYVLLTLLVARAPGLSRAARTLDAEAPRERAGLEAEPLAGPAG